MVVGPTQSKFLKAYMRAQNIKITKVLDDVHEYCLSKSFMTVIIRGNNLLTATLWRHPREEGPPTDNFRVASTPTTGKIIMVGRYLSLSKDLID